MGKYLREIGLGSRVRNIKFLGGVRYVSGYDVLEIEYFSLV